MGSSSSGSGGQGGGSQPVAIAQFTYASSGLSDPSSGAPRFGVNLTFALVNSGASAIATMASFALDAGSVHAEGALTCSGAGATWKIAAGARAAWPGEVHDQASNGPTAISFGAPTDCSAVGFTFAPAAPAASYNGPVTLTLKGTLADATPFVATASVQKSQ